MEQRMGLGRPMWRGVLAAAIGAVPLSGCGASAPEAAAPARAPAIQVASVSDVPTTDAKAAAPAANDASAERSAAAASAEPERALPTECAPGSEPCAAPGKFVDQLCHGKYPDVALAMLAKGTPWRRG